MYNKSMEIEFDPAKDENNRAKHGVPLFEADGIEWGPVWALPDERRDYTELRVVGFAYIGLRFHCVVYTDRADTRRIISLRKANTREIKRYAKA